MASGPGSDHRARAGRERDRAAPRSRPWLVAVVGAVGVALIASAALGHSGIGNEIADAGLIVAVFAGAALSCLVRAVVSRADRRIWLLLGLGLAGWSAQAFYILNPDEPLAFPSPVDLAALGFYVCAAAVAVLLVRREGSKTGLAFWLDGLLGALVAADLGAVIVLEQAVAGSGIDRQILYGQLSYAVADLFVLGVVTALWLSGGWRASQSHRLFTAAFTLLAAGDSIYLRAVAHGDTDPSAVVTSLWAAGPLLLAAVPWVRRTAHAREPARSLSTDLAPPVIAAAVAITIVVIHVLKGHSGPGFSDVLSLVVLPLAAVRMVVALIENVRAHEALTSSVTDLEAAYAERDRAAGLSLAITDSVVDGIYVTDTRELLTFINPAAVRLLGYDSAEELLGRPVHATVHHTRPDGTPYPIADCPLLNVRTAGQPIHIDEEVYWRKDGTPLPVAASAAPIGLVDGTGVVVAFRDISVAQAEREELRAQARHVVWFERVLAALNEGRFVLHGQPIVDLATGAVVKHELLLRMISPTGEIIAPGLFLPAAEKYDLINDIDRWVISEAVGLAAGGRRVALNLSALSVGRVEILLHIEHELSRTGAPAENLTFEVTETALMEDLQAGRRFADRLAARGCSFSLDDFGTGYGSLTYLRQFPVSEVKIDVQFVRELAHSEADQKLVQAIVQIANSLGKTTIAEGVEDQQTLDLLRDYGIDCVQGYHVGRPEPFAAGASDAAARATGVGPPVAGDTTELTRDEIAERRDVAASSRDIAADVHDTTTGRREDALSAAEESTLLALLAASEQARSLAATDRASARSDRETAATEREYAAADGPESAPDEAARLRDRAADARDNVADTRDRVARRQEEALLAV